MRKDTETAKLNGYEIERSIKIWKKRYIVEQDFALSYLHDGAKRGRFSDMMKNKFDCWYRQAEINISKWLKILGVATVSDVVRCDQGVKSGYRNGIDMSHVEQHDASSLSRLF